MNNLVTLQRWAERYARKLGIEDTVRIVPEKDCPKPGKPWPHCHLIPPLRGTICWPARPDRTARWWLEKRGWKALLAHEVCHLRVKSHHSPYFARWMARLGFAPERKVAVAAGLILHRHTWGPPCYLSLSQPSVRRTCRNCGAYQEGKIAWGRTQRRRTV